ncbi:MAG: MBL fold metallo-hydrolase, partial [Clostridia bacterium]
MKRRLFCFLCAFMLMIAAGCTNNNTQAPKEEPTKPKDPVANETVKTPSLEVMVLQVGKADAILITLDGKSMLIDAGETKDGSRVAALLRDKGISKLDYVVLTHMDKDHIGGIPRVMMDAEVGTLIQSHNSEGSAEYSAYQAELKEDSVTPILLRKPMEFEFGGAQVRLLPAEKEKYADDNDYSIITELTYGEKRFLFTGDAEKERLAEYLAGEVKPFNFVKMPHHGNKNKQSKAFINAAHPEYAVITSSDKNPANYEILSMLKAIKANVFQTKDGYVTAVCDGTTLT